MRVVAGRLKGRRLQAVAGLGTRPTSDRVKESLFQRLGGTLEPEPVLDLFAGTGALGVEAFSRGAEPVVFVESHRNALGVLRRNVEPLRDFAQVLPMTAERALLRLLREPTRFALILADPPYRETERFFHRYADQVVALLRPGGALVVEHRSDCTLPELPGTQTVDARTYGDTAVARYRKERP